MIRILIVVFISFLICFTNIYGLSLGRVYVTELFSTKIEPLMFNWTFGQTEHFKYRCSLKGYPDLPTWMNYIYSNEYHAGYLYGTPPEHLSGYEINIDVIGLNKLTYETGHITLSLFITRRNFNPKNSIHMKIDNLNWVNFMDPGRVENLKNIFQIDLWPESNKDLHIMFMESAIKMGGRVPLRPQQKEGVVVHLGSSSEFSQKLIDLQKEVKPLYKIATCTYKRTSVQTIFENAGFKIDWCAFRIVGNEMATNNAHGSEKSTLFQKDVDRWEPISLNDVPQRNYIVEMTVAIAIPGMVFAILVGILSAVLCFHHENIYDELSEIFFDNIFHICTDFIRYNKKQTQPIVQMVQYSNVNSHTTTTTTTLKSLKDPNQNTYDNLSLHSNNSPCNSINQLEGSPRSNSTIRPRPPPYKSSIVYRNGVEI